MSNKTAVQEKPLPKKCVCGKEPVLVSIRGADVQLPEPDEMLRESADRVAQVGDPCR